MNRAQLLALAAAVGALGAGGALFWNRDTSTVDKTIEDVGAWEQIDKSSCSTAACNTAQCTAAKNVLTDAGSSCTPRLVSCDFRVSPRMRACFADAGTPLSAKRYQRLQVVALRCPGRDGGFAFGTPFDANQCPIFAAAVDTPLCVRAPLDGGPNCLRLGAALDGGARFFGTGNVFPASQSSGSQCEPVGCSVMYGDNPETDL